MTSDGASHETTSTDGAHALMQSSFVHLRFKGGRFEGQAAPPLASMAELAQINDLIMALAPIMWRRTKGAKRIREGNYPSAPVLRIERFAQGSSIPVIVRDGGSATLLNDPYEASRDLMERTFQEIVANTVIPEDFPPECIPKLRQVGKSFQPGESAAFLVPDAQGVWNETLFTAEIRESFWENFDHISEDTLTLTGKLVSLHREPQRLVLLLPSGQKIDGKFEEGHIWDDLHRSLGTLSKHPYTRLKATVERDYLNRIVRITDVRAVEVMETLAEKWHDRFLELLGLRDAENPSRPLASIFHEAWFPVGQGLPAA
ncbi:hypothetical protein [Pseudarthrobacter albicanus]|uniref:hypothetical protein n=1 Tax=Pseudarthrobacter albicanus TaxID=2823873 RepID=UPI001BA84DA3|nr:hypothetical protein [Pseudarthrobacter albicanus]